MISDIVSFSTLRIARSTLQSDADIGIHNARHECQQSAPTDGACMLLIYVHLLFNFDLGKSIQDLSGGHNLLLVYLLSCLQCHSMFCSLEFRCLIS